MNDIGLNPQMPSASSVLATRDDWNYTSFETEHVPSPHPQNHERFSPIYRGVVPVKNLFKRDFAVNGANVNSVTLLPPIVFTFLSQTATNNGYIWEVISHWISSYFLADPFLSLPPTVEDALFHAERRAAWLRRRYPHAKLWENQSGSANFVLLTWASSLLMSLFY
jgi:dimethylaniline monooxygenase (N-oxide forming)